MIDFTLFTQDNRPAIILPNDCHYTKLLIEKAHRKGHIGAVTTVAMFRIGGFWTS